MKTPPVKISKAKERRLADTAVVQSMLDQRERTQTDIAHACGMESRKAKCAIKRLVSRGIITATRPDKTYIYKINNEEKRNGD